jgi:hypothetical protein
VAQVVAQLGQAGDDRNRDITRRAVLAATAQEEVALAVLLIERTGRRTDDTRAHRGLLISVAWGPHDATGVAVIRRHRGGHLAVTGGQHRTPTRKTRSERACLPTRPPTSSDPIRGPLPPAGSRDARAPAPAPGSGFLLVRPS